MSRHPFTDYRRTIEAEVRKLSTPALRYYAKTSLCAVVRGVCERELDAREVPA